MATMAVHGGAGPDAEYIRENARGYKESLKAAIMKGHEVLDKKGNAVDRNAANFLIIFLNFFLDTHRLEI